MDLQITANQTTEPSRAREPGRAHRPVLVGISKRERRAAICRTIAARGHEVIAVPDGFHLTQRIADAILGDSGLRPSVIIAEPILRGCTGVSLAAGLRELGWDIPIVFVVDARDALGRAQVWHLDATGVFVEPVDLSELGAFIDLVLDPDVSDVFRARQRDLAVGTNPGVDV